MKQTLEIAEGSVGTVRGEEAELEVRSPIDGEIVTWDLHDHLLLRPVRRGDVLLRVADPTGPWQLELHMPENRMGHITKYERKTGEPLEVTYILSSEAGTTYHGTIKEIHKSAEIRGDEGNTVLIKVELDKEEMEQLRAEQKLRQDASVTAKVYCGRRPLGYVLLHDLFEFIQTRVLFRYF